MTDVAIDERPPGAGAPNNRLLLNVGLLLLLVILGVGLLYAYRAQSPAMRQISYTEAVTQIQNGQIQRVAIQGERARITRTDGSVEEVTLPDGGQLLVQAVTDRNRADPAHAVALQYDQSSPSLGLWGSVLLSLLPLLLLIALVLLASRAFTRGRSGDRYDALRRAADLRDRGVLTEEEFQREKKRLLG